MENKFKSKGRKVTNNGLILADGINGVCEMTRGISESPSGKTNTCGLKVKNAVTGIDTVCHAFDVDEARGRSTNPDAAFKVVTEASDTQAEEIEFNVDGLNLNVGNGKYLWSVAS